jgi:hypothetical protein
LALLFIFNCLLYDFLLYKLTSLKAWANIQLFLFLTNSISKKIKIFFFENRI